jgi:formate-dependent nitrite reductase membrane component NrfD
MAVGYKFQSQWIKNRGKFLILAIYTGGLGGAAYILSLIYGYIPGIIVGFIALALGKPLFHLLFLGRPERFLRAFINVRSSWISRGIWGITLFIIMGGLYILPLIGFQTWLMDTVIWSAIGAASLLLALFLIVYDGFLLASCKGIPFWNNSILTVLFPVASMISGLGIILVILSLQPSITIEPILFEKMEVLILTSGAILIAFYLLTAKYVDLAASQSVRSLTIGNLSNIFWLAILFGIVIPITASTYSLLTEATHYYLVGIAATIELIGDFMVKYSFFRAGIHRPLIYTWSYPSIYGD